MAFKHFEGIACRADGGFSVASSALTGNTWNGSLWYFDNWDHYQHTCNIDMYNVATADGIADIKWYDETNLLVGSDSGCVGVWSLVAPGNDLENVRVLNASHDEMVLCVGVTCSGESGKLVFSGGGEGNVILNDLACEKRLGSFKGHVGWVTSLDTHPSVSKVLVSVGMDCLMNLWDLRKPSLVTSRIAPPSTSSHGSFQSVSWSALDEFSIAAGSETGYITLYDLRNTSSCVTDFQPHTRSVHRILFSPVFKGVVASGSDDFTVQVHNTSAHQYNILCDKSHHNFVRGLSWYGDFSLLSCAWDGKIHNHIFKEENLNISKKQIEEQMPRISEDDEKENKLVRVGFKSGESEENVAMECTNSSSSVNGLNKDIVIP